MMLGTAARSSMAVPSGLRSQGGDISVRNKAMPKLTGMAINRAINEVSSVPTMGVSAPNSSVTGFHALLVRNPKPNFSMAGRLPMSSEAMMAASTISTRKANERAAHSNATSSRRCFRRRWSGIWLDMVFALFLPFDIPAKVFGTELILIALSYELPDGTAA